MLEPITHCFKCELPLGKDRVKGDYGETFHKECLAEDIEEQKQYQAEEEHYHKIYMDRLRFLEY